MRKTILLNLLSSALLVSLAAGCSKIETIGQNSGHRFVSFSVESVSSTSGPETRSTNLTEEPLVDSLYLLLTEEDWPVKADVATKGTIITTDSFQTTYSADGFGVYAEKSGDASTVLFNNAVFTYNNSSSLWLPPTNVYWPDYATDFYVWAPKGVASLSSSSKSFSYTVPVANADQKDLLVAKTSVEASNESAVSLVFTHALAAVRFVVGSTMTEGKITSLKICGLNTSGTYDMAAGTWGSLSSKEDLSLTTEVDMTADTPAGTAITGDSETFFVIPQVCSDGASVEIVFDDETKTIPLPAAHEFKAGKIYTLKLSAEPHTYEYTFELVNESDAQKIYSNTTEAFNDVIKLSSYRTVDAADKEDVTWVIKSVTAGSATTQAINAASFGDIAGLSATASNSSTLSLTAAERTKASPGSHDYWLNQNPKRTDNLGWSPEDWTSATASNPIDLSKFDFHTEEKNKPMTTANCYIIRHAGTYKLPLVYGNAVVNGNDNVQSYYPNCNGDITDGENYIDDDRVGTYNTIDPRRISVEGNNRLVHFVNHLGNAISDAFIENNEGCVAKDAVIVWQDMAKVIKDVSIVGAESGKSGTYDASNVRYLQFTVDPNTVCQSNAIIAVRDAENNIIWSWHIWTTNDPKLLSGPISVWNNTNNKYDFFPLNTLGWIDPEQYLPRPIVKIVLQQKHSGNEIEIGVVQVAQWSGFGYGCWYQFGRKDPMPPVDNRLGRVQVVDGAFEISNGDNIPDNVSLSVAIRTPGVFYRGGEDNYGSDTQGKNWCTTLYYNLWTGKRSAGGVLPTTYPEYDLIKTVYDPSPVGYKVPSGNAYTGFTSKGTYTTNKSEFSINPDGDTTKGYDFRASTHEEDGFIFFPFAAYRDNNSGAVRGNDSGYTAGIYWSCEPTPYYEDATTPYPRRHQLDAPSDGYCLNIAPGNSYSIWEYDGTVRPNSNSYRSRGFSVRPVATSPVMVGSSKTVTPYEGEGSDLKW